METEITITELKRLGKEKNEKNLDYLINLYNNYDFDVSKKREIVSSIGRQSKINKGKVYSFVESNIFKKNYMDVIYQMYRTILYNQDSEIFRELANRVEKFYENEMIYKMKEYYSYRKKRNKQKKQIIDNKIKSTTLLEGDSKSTLKTIQDFSIQLVFTSPPYYNAREYSNYKSYNEYLDKMKSVFMECHRVLEDGRFIIMNVSPVITKRPGREFESIRYPIHFDYHKIMEEIGFYFVDEIIWIKPEPSVPNRNGGYVQTRKPLSYKPNCITESILVYRKKASFLLDENIKIYKNFVADKDSEFQLSNCWYIAPSSNKNHPAIFPDELCKRVLKYYSYENDVVLDPFAGSGTFGRVAMEMNRIPVLCEKNNDYINYIKKELKI